MVTFKRKPANPARAQTLFDVFNGCCPGLPEDKEYPRRQRAVTDVVKHPIFQQTSDRSGLSTLLQAKRVA